MTEFVDLEGKVLEKMRDLLKADPTVIFYVGTRAGTEHPSTIDRPEYPCISFHIVISHQSFQIPDMTDIIIQVDYWFPSDTFTTDDIMKCNGAVRALLHRQNLTDLSKNLITQNVVQTDAGPMMYDQNIRLRHYPSRYRVVAI